MPGQPRQEGHLLWAGDDDDLLTGLADRGDRVPDERLPVPVGQQLVAAEPARPPAGEDDPRGLEPRIRRYAFGSIHAPRSISRGTTSTTAL